jgi:hypothetical protein
MMQHEFEPSAASLFLVVQFRVIQDVSSLNLGPLFAEAAFEQMLPADFVLGVDKHAKDGFIVAGIHLEVLVGESTSSSLEWCESKIELVVIVGKSIAQGAKKLFMLE